MPLLIYKCVFPIFSFCLVPRVGVLTPLPVLHGFESCRQSAHLFRIILVFLISCFKNTQQFSSFVVLRKVHMMAALKNKDTK